MIFLKEPDPEVRKVDDLDFTFINGTVFSVVLDLSSGDSIEYPTQDTIVIHQVAKVEDDEFLASPQEDTTLYTRNIMFIQHRRREVTDLTQAQKDQWQKTFQEMNPKTVQ